MLQAPSLEALFSISFASAISSFSGSLLFLQEKEDRDSTDDTQPHRLHYDRCNVPIRVCLPSLLNRRGHQQSDDADAHGAHDHSEDNEPWRGVRVDWCCQGGDDVNEIQSLIS